MTTPTTYTFSDAVTVFTNSFSTSVTNARAAVNTAPPGAVQSGIDFSALFTADFDFAQVAADVVLVFTQDFEAPISETLAAIGDVLSAGILAGTIVADIESAIQIGITAGAGAAPAAVAAAAPAAATAAERGGAAAPAATAATVSSVLAQVQQQATANLTLVNQVFQNAKSAPLSDNLPSGNELQVLGGQILFQQNIDAVLNSFPASMSAPNESNAALIGTLQNLLTVEQDLSTLLSEIDTNVTYEQAITLTGLNVALVLADAVILTNTSLAFAAYALFALEGLAGQLVTVSAAGPYTVNIPSGAKYVDIVLSGAAGGGGGYDTSGAGGAGGETTATPTGGSTLTAAGGTGGASSESAAATAGGSPGNESFDGQTYIGGIGGAAGANSPGGAGTAPGGGGGGGGAFGSVGGQGGSAGAWAEETIAITSAMTQITGSVGAGGVSGPGTTPFTSGGAGGNGSAFFYFYS